MTPTVYLLDSVDDGCCLIGYIQDENGGWLLQDARWNPYDPLVIAAMMAGIHPSCPAMERVEVEYEDNDSLQLTVWWQDEVGDD
ncbi:MAG: hypothetical protein ABIH46_10765 [Chloroflexota bacterium]